MDDFPGAVDPLRHPRQAILHRAQDLALLRDRFIRNRPSGGREVGAGKNPDVVEVHQHRLGAKGRQPLLIHLTPGGAFSNAGPVAPQVEGDWAR
jgi:hypothetical protein